MKQFFPTLTIVTLLCLGNVRLNGAETSQPSATPTPTATTTAAQAPVVAPAIEFLYGERELYPAALLCFTDASPYAPRDTEQLGDPQGVISVAVTAPAAGCLVTVTLRDTVFYEESRVTCRLPEAGERYHIAPMIRFRADRLAAQKQPLANLVVSAQVEIAGERTELSTKVVVHSVNDYILRYKARLEDGGTDSNWNVYIKYMAAAYVNENNPWIDQRLTRHALDHGYVRAFMGYQKGEAGVQDEVKAIYNTLNDLGFKYTNFPAASVASVNQNLVQVQAVRLVSDALESAQANRLEIALIFASILRKMAIDSVIIMVPPQTMLGIYRAKGRDPKSLIYLDPRVLGSGPFEAALTSGGKVIEANKHNLVLDVDSSKDVERSAAEANGFFAIDIRHARELGILPIPEVRRDFRSAPRDFPSVSPTPKP